jgi:glycosyltransferase involved in cell wall biosynthesis
MRIGLLTTSFPRTADDSAGSFVLGFCRALVRHGHSVEVLAPEPPEPCTPLREPGLVLHHVRYLWPRSLQRTFYGAGAPDNLARDPRAWLGPLPFALALARRARALSARWDAVVSHWALPCALIARAAVPRPLPHLAVLHSADVHALGRVPGRSRLARRITHGAQGLWFVTHQQRARFAALLPAAERALLNARAWVSPMGIELPALELSPLARERARAELGLKGFTVLALGRLVPIKGLDVLIRALAGSDIRLLVAGAGPELDPLRDLARMLRVDARFVGEVSGATKTALLTAADAFVIPSRVLPGGRSEGLPVALLEAMAHGLPVVASAVGGIVEVVPGDGSAGLLVAPDRPGELARALERARGDDAWRSRASRVARDIALRHGWDHAILRGLRVLEGQNSWPDRPPTP